MSQRELDAMRQRFDDLMREAAARAERQVGK